MHFYLVIIIINTYQQARARIAIQMNNSNQQKKFFLQNMFNHPNSFSFNVFPFQKQTLNASANTNMPIQQQHNTRQMALEQGITQFSTREHQIEDDNKNFKYIAQQTLQTLQKAQHENSKTRQLNQYLKIISKLRYENDVLSQQKLLLQKDKIELIHENKCLKLKLIQWKQTEIEEFYRIAEQKVSKRMKIQYENQTLEVERGLRLILSNHQQQIKKRDEIHIKLQQELKNIKQQLQASQSSKKIVYANSQEIKKDLRCSQTKINQAKSMLEGLQEELQEIKFVPGIKLIPDHQSFLDYLSYFLYNFRVLMSSHTKIYKQLLFKYHHYYPEEKCSELSLTQILNNIEAKLKEKITIQQKRFQQLQKNIENLVYSFSFEFNQSTSGTQPLQIATNYIKHCINLEKQLENKNISKKIDL